MGKPHPLALRARVVAFVEEGRSHRAAAAHFRVSPRFVNNMMILKRETGCLEPARQRRPESGKLSGHADWLRMRLAEDGDATLDELSAELAEQGVSVHRATVGRELHRAGLSHKKNTSGQ